MVGILYTLTGLCFFLSFRAGKRTTAWWTLWALVILISMTVFEDMRFLVVFIWPGVLAFQIVFIIYWTFRLFKRPKLSTLFAALLTCVFAYIALSPWIDDWTFSKNDARKILLTHQIDLKDDFEIIDNEASVGFRDCYQTFRLKLSGHDFDQIDRSLRTSGNFLGTYHDITKTPYAHYRQFDTVDFETPYHIEREYWSRKKMDDGTFHFRIQLGKTDSVLNYIGSNE